MILKTHKAIDMPYVTLAFPQFSITLAVEFFYYSFRYSCRFISISFLNFLYKVRKNDTKPATHGFQSIEIF